MPFLINCTNSDKPLDYFQVSPLFNNQNEYLTVNTSCFIQKCFLHLYMDIYHDYHDQQMKGRSKEIYTNIVAKVHS